MRVLILENDYDAFLGDLYAREPELEAASYAEQARVRSRQHFGIAEAYAGALRRLGHDVEVVYTNNDRMQAAWRREHGRRRARRAPRPRRLPGRLGRRFGRPWLDRTVLGQIEAASADALVCLGVELVDPRLLAHAKRHVGVLVGQHAATPLHHVERLRCYDLFLSSFPPTVERLRELGARAEPFRLGFDRDVLRDVPAAERVHDVTFVGSLFAGVHDSRVQLVERLCEEFDGMRVWTSSVDGLPADSAIRRRHAGAAWGRDMYAVLRASYVTVNHHGDVPDYANNCRLYEATGCGALLVTDARRGLDGLFEPGREVIAYADEDAAVEAVRAALADRAAGEAVARAGEARTLASHTYDDRMAELVERLRAVRPSLP